MKNFKCGVLFFLIFWTPFLKAEFFHHYPDLSEKDVVYVWEAYAESPFNQIVFTWNSLRPDNGDFFIQISLLTEEGWSPSLPYMQWGKGGQHSLGGDTPFPVRINQDVVLVDPERTAIAFRVTIYATEEANLKEVWALHACSCGTSQDEIEMCDLRKYSNLGVPLISQISLNSPIGRRLCSPVCVAAVMSYLKKKPFDPLYLAPCVRDDRVDIYGNWSLNVSQALSEMGRGWEGWVSIKTPLKAVVELLENRCPVVVSVKGPLLDSALPYTDGHLIVVKGMTPYNGGEVICMDPAFPCDEETKMEYPLADFVGAWKRNGGVAYIIKPRQE